MKEETFLYVSLDRVLEAARKQAAEGKGRERHGGEEPFDKSQMVEIGTRLSGNVAGGPLFQAVKKIYETKVLSPEMAIQELYGAINYIAGAILIYEKLLPPANEVFGR